MGTDNKQGCISCGQFFISRKSNNIITGNFSPHHWLDKNLIIKLTEIRFYVVLDFAKKVRPRARAGADFYSQPVDKFLEPCRITEL